MSQPRIIGSRYELVRPIGEGGMGVVYAALDRLTGDEVALKQVTVAPKNLSFNTRSSPVSDLRMALAREFQTLASLRHPHIISVRDYGFDSEQRPFFTMTLLNQPVTLLQAADDLDDSGRLELILQVLQALEYLHRRGIIHRDLKPANVLVTQSGQVKVLDFGLAMQGDAPQEISGTLLYMPPEILQGKPATRASDLYAVGMMAHEMFAGKHPFRTENFSLLLADIMNTIPDPMTVPDMTEPESGVSWRGIVSRLLEKDPLDRYQSAGEVIRMVSRLPGVRTVPETTAIRDSYLQAAQFVGRSAEMGQLTAAIDALMDGRGSRWLIAGESGVGKSRFIEEVRTRALVEGATVLRGQEIAESRLSYHLWHDAVRRLLLTTDLDDLQLSILKEIIPDIAALKGRDIPDAPPLDGADARQRLGLAVLALFRQQKQPIVLIMEDLHWSSDSLDILRLLNRAADAQPLIIIGTYRDDEEFDVAEQLPTMQLLKLERLTERDVSQLAVSMLGEVGQRPEILSLLQRETEGNVYFLVETLRALAEEAGSLDDVARMDLPRHVLAGGVQQIIQRRLGQVPPEYVPLLRVAALIGRQLDLLLMWTVVQTLPEAEQVDVDTWLTVCANVPVFSNYDGRWRFAHDKLREGVLNEIEASARPDLHRLIARSIESAYPDDPEQARVLADHWHDAGDTDKALTYAITAVGVALARGNVTGAVQLLERALVTLDDQPDDPRRVTVLKLSGDAYEALSRYDEATTAYQESLTLAQARDDGAGVVSALNGLANVALKRGDLDTAQAQYDAVITRVADFAVSDQHADALNGLGTIAARRGQIEVARGYYDRSLALRRDINDQKGIAASLNNLGIIARYQGDLPRAIEYLNEALSLRRAIGDRRGVAATLSNLGITARQAGDYDTACEYYEQGVVITREIGDMHGVAAMLNNLGFARMAQKEHAAARTIFEEGLALVRRIGDRRGIAHALHNLGQLAVEQGDPSRAIDLLQESVTVAQEIDDPRGAGMARLDLARAQAQLGLIDQAFESAEAARAIYERIGDRAGQVQSGLVMVTLHVQSADFPTAENLLRPLFARFEPRPNDQLRDALMLLIQIWLPYKRWEEVARLTGFVLQNTADTSETARYLRSVRARLEFALGETETQAIITAGKQTTAEDILAFVRARPAIV